MALKVKKMGKKTLLLICTLLLCILLIRTGTTNAQLSTVAVNPASLTVDQPNELFNVTITITDAPEMTQFIINNITWDPTVLELETGTETDIVEGPFLKSFGSTVFLTQSITSGKIGEVTCVLSSEGYASGSGDLFTIKFRSKAEGISDINIGFCVLLKELDVADLPQLQNGTITVIPEFPMHMFLIVFLLVTTTIALMARSQMRKRRLYPVAT